MALDSPPGTTRHMLRPSEPRLRWNAWNLLLLLPLIALFTPLYNRIEPRLFGMPFFYWFQLALVLVGLLLTVFVFPKTRDDYEPDDRPNAGMLDHRTWR